jgi:hypothetical protein
VNVFGQSPHVFDPRIETQERDPEYWDRVHKARAAIEAERKRDEEKNRLAREAMRDMFRKANAEAEARMQRDEQIAAAKAALAGRTLEEFIVELLDRVAALEGK